MLRTGSGGGVNSDAIMRDDYKERAMMTRQVRNNGSNGATVHLANSPSITEKIHNKQ